MENRGRFRLKNHKAILSLKLDQVCIDGEPQNPGAFLTTTDVVSCGDQITERQQFCLVIKLHDMRISQNAVRVIWGISPMSALATGEPVSAQLIKNQALR